jgi:sterol desaturase/sphingolipid hydroxylase (fatty acid hydroxylase superfamily)
MVLELLQTTIVHSGYAVIPGLNRLIRFHDWHHEFFNGCFGSMGVIDWVHGTDKGFQRTYGKGEVITPRKHRRSRLWVETEE